MPVWLSIIAQFAGKRHTNAVPLQKKEYNKMIQLLLSVSDWPIIMIGPRGLLLVVPHLFAVPVSVL